MAESGGGGRRGNGDTARQKGGESERSRFSDCGTGVRGGGWGRRRFRKDAASFFFSLLISRLFFWLVLFNLVDRRRRDSDGPMGRWTDEFWFVFCLLSFFVFRLSSFVLSFVLPPNEKDERSAEAVPLVGGNGWVVWTVCSMRSRSAEGRRLGRSGQRAVNNAMLQERDAKREAKVKSR